MLTPPADLISGTLIRKISGAGLIKVEGREHPLKLNKKNTRHLADGDVLQVKIVRSTTQNRESCVPVKLISRRKESFLGYFTRKDKSGIVRPINPKICEPVHIPMNNSVQVKNHQVVIAKIDPNDLDMEAGITGRIVRVIGYRNSFGVETEMLVFKHGLRNTTSQALKSEVASILKHKGIADGSRRTDNRKYWTITVDPSEARDFDDALSVVKKPDGFRLGVHIADVTYFVKEDSQIDIEAFQRGTTIYFPERAIHMLPDKLATDICSLKPNTDRQAMTVWIDLDRSGNILGGECEQSLIHSNARLTYEEFTAALGPNPPAGMDLQTINLCFELAELCELLMQQRTARGVMDLDIPEAKFEFDKNGNLIGIHKKTRGIAEKSIEEFMIAANIVVARFLDAKKIPYLRRIHEPPDLSALDELRESISKLGVTPPVNPLDPDQVRDMFSHLPSQAVRSVISYLILRSLKRAVYSPQKKSHFGLALDSYTQFTSPIRRYPDMQVHRAVKCALGIQPYHPLSISRLESDGKWLSEREQAAQEAEWDAVKKRKIKFMKQFIGQEFTATITHIEPFAAFVEVQEPFVDGMIPVYRLKEYYTFMEAGNALVNPDGTRILRPGAIIRVRLDYASVDRGMLDFSPVF